MIQVINKAFDMLEYLAKDPRRRIKLNEISGHFKINPGTCANILKTLVQRGFVDQEKVRGGYLLGPMIYYLSRSSAYRADLVAAAEPVMADVVKKVNESVLLAILRGNKRFVVLQMDGKQSVQVNHDMFFQENIYQTATGRLLLAYLSEQEQDALIAEKGLPGFSWPEASSLKKIKIELNAIRRRGWVIHQPFAELIAIACPISENGKVVASLGLFLPAFRFKGAHKTEIMRVMSASSVAISARMRNEN